MPQNRGPAMKFLDPNDPFFRPLWVRLATVLAPVGWGLVELLWMRSTTWSLVFFAAGFFAAWKLFLQRRDE